MSGLLQQENVVIFEKISELEIVSENSQWHEELIVFCAARRSSLNLWRAYLSCSDTVVNLLGNGKVIL